jgi:hypothetical protein
MNTTTKTAAGKVVVAIATVVIPVTSTDIVKPALASSNSNDRTRFQYRLSIEHFYLQRNA